MVRNDDKSGKMDDSLVIKLIFYIYLFSRQDPFTSDSHKVEETAKIYSKRTHLDSEQTRPKLASTALPTLIAGKFDNKPSEEDLFTFVEGS